MESVGADAVVYDLDGTLVRLTVDWDAVSREAASALESRGIEPPGGLWEMLVRAEEAGHRDAVEAVIAAHERDGATESERLPAADFLVREEPDQVGDYAGSTGLGDSGSSPEIGDGGDSSRTGDGSGTSRIGDGGAAPPGGPATGGSGPAVAVGVCSLNCTEACHIALERHGLAERVEAVVGRDSVPGQKPDPEPLLATVRQLGATPDRVVFVGDSERDELTAQRAGVRFVYVEDWLQRA